jgi:hypothetical protein
MEESGELVGAEEQANPFLPTKENIGIRHTEKKPLA